jgi:hypothetical protein
VAFSLASRRIVPPPHLGASPPPAASAEPAPDAKSPAVVKSAARRTNRSVAVLLACIPMSFAGRRLGGIWRAATYARLPASY